MFATSLIPVASARHLENTVSFGNVNISILLSAEDTGGSFALFESMMRPGTEPPYHVHEREDETFHILGGHLSVMVDGVIHECRQGETIFLPRGIPHTFRVRSAVAHALTYVTPGGFEKYFQMVGKPAAALDPPMNAIFPAGYRETMGRAASWCGVRMLETQPEF